MSPRVRTVWAALSVAMVAAGGPVVYTVERGGARAGVAVGGSSAVWLLLQRSRHDVGAVLLMRAAALGVVTGLVAGPFVAVWIVAGHLLAEWGLRCRPVLWGEAPARPVFALVGPAVVGMWWATLSSAEGRIALSLLVCFVLVGWAARRDVDIQGWIASVGRRVSRVVVLAGLGALSAIAVLGPWAVGRVARLDPLSGDFGWRERGDHRVRWGQLWAPEPTRSVSRGARLRGVAASLLLVAGIAGVFVALRDRWSTRVDVPAAFEGDAWYVQHFRDMNFGLDPDGAFDPLAALRIRDMASPTVNIIDGQRVTWRPPECACRRLRVWMYGGSTTFGSGQRDAHTISSELARIAHENGVVVDVENRGVVGDTHWEEAQRLAWDLEREPAPDLILFYDGVNEVAAIDWYRSDLEPPAFVAASIWNQAHWGLDPPPDGAPTASPPGPAVDRGSSVDEIGRTIAERYESARSYSAALAESAGTEVVYAWQPSTADREIIPGEYEDGGREFARRRSEATTAALAPDVIDLTGVFDGVDRPIFYDNVHTNEEGARIVAEALHDRIGPLLQELARD
jgi:lysophospholipase L1-like esterase